MKASQRKT